MDMALTNLLYRAVLITFTAICLSSSSSSGAGSSSSSRRRLILIPSQPQRAASFTRAHHLPSHVPPLFITPPPRTSQSHLQLDISPPNHFSFKFPPPPLNKKKETFNLTPAATTVMENGGDCVVDVDKLRSDFLRVLRARRNATVTLAVEQAKPVKHPLFQDEKPPAFSEVMESCPKADIPDLKEQLNEENLYLITEAGEQGRLPVLILSLKGGEERKPAVVFLHSTHKNKEWLRPLLEAYASRGYVSIAIDSRYHGERAHNKTTYRDALVGSWKKGDTMPFIFDTAWDLIKLADYLTQREDIDSTRIGITGESLGGMHAWFGAFADVRYSVVVPIIGVQGFRWAIDNDKWQARVDSIRAVFEEARMDSSKKAIDKEVVEKVWNRIAPGLATNFDSPYTIPAISPRPLLIINGAEDPRCPIGGIQSPILRALTAYEEADATGKFKVVAEPGIGHQMTKFMVKEASDWFDQYLKQ